MLVAHSASFGTLTFVLSTSSTKSTPKLHEGRPCDFYPSSLLSDSRDCNMAAPESLTTLDLSGKFIIVYALLLDDIMYH